MTRVPGLIAAPVAFLLSSFVAVQSAPPATGGPALLSESLSPASLDQARLDEFATRLDRAALTEDFVGLAVAVVRGGEIVLVRTYGALETGGSAPVTPDTAFRIASLSKGFAASLAGLAMAEGRIDRATPVAPYAPRLALKGDAHRALTVEHILSHRVGLPPNAYDNLLEAGTPVADILPRFRTVNPICAIGACYSYQNITFNLIADVLAAAYDRPYEELVRERIFTPLGMRHASFGAADLAANGDWARPHVRDPVPGMRGVFTPWRTVNISDAYYRTPAAGGVNASILDLAEWLKAQMGRAPEVLPGGVLASLHAPAVRTPAETRRWRALGPRITDTHYGLGWRIYTYGGHAVLNHSGGVEGYGAQIAWLPERDVGIVVLANTRAKRVWRIVPTFLDMELDLDDSDWLELETNYTETAGDFGAEAGQP
jgi:beta-lactamase class C